MYYTLCIRKDGLQRIGAPVLAWKPEALTKPAPNSETELEMLRLAKLRRTTDETLLGRGHNIAGVHNTAGVYTNFLIRNMQGCYAWYRLSASCGRALLKRTPMHRPLAPLSGRSGFLSEALDLLPKDGSDRLNEKGTCPRALGGSNK